MKCKTLEIRWHDRTPIFSTDFHATPPHAHKKAHHPYAAGAGLGGVEDGGEGDAAREERERERDEREKKWRLATCGQDNQVRLWLVHPRPPPSAPPASAAASSSTSTAPVPSASIETDPRVEYLATLSQHTGVVNCVRFAPCGEMLASAGDDGNILIWVPGEGSKKIGETDEDKMYEKESWRVKSMIRSMSGKEIYDLAWSPDGEKILAGSVDHTATIYDVASGLALARIADHNNYVQGVAWDPLEKFIATQSSDRSMHVYSYAPSPTGIATHAVGKNARMEVQRKPPSRSSSLTRATSSSSSGAAKKPDSGSKPPSDTPVASTSKAGNHSESEFVVPSSTSRPPMHQRSLSRASDTSDRSEASSTAPSSIFSVPPSAPPKPDEVTTPMDPPTGIPHHPKPHSRRSSTSGSAPSASPSLHPHGAHPSTSRPLRSPSPAPLPAVMVPLSPRLNPTTSGSLPSFNEQVRTDTIRLYGDANSTRFFRRLAWSPDGGLLLTPAGLFEDPYAAVNAQAGGSKKDKEKEKEKAKKDKDAGGDKDSSDVRPTVYIYSRANLGRPPVAHLPGHQKVSIAIRFCPVLWDLRDLGGASGAGEDEGKEQDEAGVSVKLSTQGVDVPLEKGKGKGKAKEEMDVDAAAATAEGKKVKPRSLFDLPYRMVYAVATYDCVYLYDTQQAAPIAMFSGLHYKPFTDLTWSADGQTLMISSEDGYCSVVAFAPGELGTAYPHQVPHAHRPHHAHPLHDPHAGHNHPAHSSTTSSAASPAKVADTPSSSAATPGALPALFAKAAASSPVKPSPVTGVASSPATGDKRDGEGDGAEDAPPAKKQKKRVAPTLVGPLGS
ncbi:hypothetical protein JCM6882_001344 [Rhodosporidiobolus microsporus]